MAYRRFYHIIILRVLLILATCIWLAFTIPKQEKLYTLIVIIALLVLQVILLINYLNKTNRQLARFFTALKDDYTYYRVTDAFEKRTSRELSQILNETSSLLRAARIEKEKQFQFMQFVFESAPNGMIIYNPEGEIVQINKVAQNLLGIFRIKKIRELHDISPMLEEKLTTIKSGQKELLRIPRNNDFMILMIGISDIIIDGNKFRLASLQDFRNELEASEIESWQKLIRVINHEIMNSITPIITLTEATKKGLIVEGKLIPKDTINEETLKDTLLNTELIEQRSKGLKDFIDRYRTISSINKLTIHNIQFKDLLGTVLLLLQDEITKQNIQTIISIKPEDLSVECDEKLLEQVCINLFKNSMFALTSTSNPKIEVLASINTENRVIIQFIDNGSGIPKDIINDIFIPFYTTRDDGAGIGLSLSRHIMRLHKGSITAHSEPGEKTVMTLLF